VGTKLASHEQHVLDLVKITCGEVQVDDNGNFRSQCPAHLGDGLSMVAYLDPKGIRFKCFSAGCTHEEIRDALGLSESELKRKSTICCTLQDYADYKQIPKEALESFGLEDGKRNRLPVVEIPYMDRSGGMIDVRSRVSLNGETKIKSRSGSSVNLYGLWKLREWKQCESLFIVEGESDCHTLWFHDIPAVGVPGAQQVNLIMPELERIAEEFPDAQLYLVVEPDQGGLSFLQTFAKSPIRKRLKAIRLGTFKDPSELHCDNPAAFDRVWDHHVSTAVELPDAMGQQDVEDLAGLAPAVRQILLTGTGRAAKIEMCDLVSDFLLRKQRLLAAEFEEARDRVPYMIVDGTPQPLDLDCQPVRMALQDLGLNPTEQVFSFLVRHLQKVSVTDGKRVRVHRFSIWERGKLYISCGRSSIVTAEPINGSVTLCKVPSGHDGMLFEGRACFPEWEIAEAESPSSYSAFRPAVEAPAEVRAYSPDTQTMLLEAWLASVLAGVSAPIVLAYGGYGSGKSLTLEAAVRLFMGDSQSVSQAPTDVRSFCAIASAVPIMGIDNLDAQPPPWMEDVMAQAATGGDFAVRRNYSNSAVHRTRLRARIGISSRTADFARRMDIQDRLLPLFFRPMLQEQRKSKPWLLAEVDRARDAILSQLAQVAALGLCDTGKYPILPTRFQEFGRILLETVGDEAPEMLEALEAAQQMGIRDPDPLTRALVEYPKELRGTASQIMEALRRGGFRGIPMKGGKAIASRLRECSRVLELNGLDFREEQVGSNTIFTIARLET